MDYDLSSWLHNRNRAATSGGIKLKDHPSYPAWQAALEELGQQRGLVMEFRPGFSNGYVTALVGVGVDPEHIKSIHMLVFG